MLVGFPIREFEVKHPDGKVEWIDEKQLDQFNHMKTELTLTGYKRTGYCPPKWVPQSTTGGILLLDDWSRADQRILQAVMELVDRQQFISWHLPKNWHIILTSNPNDGNYFVTAMDNAQKTRFIQVKMQFNIEEWAVWAEKHGIDSRCINFLLLNPEMIKADSPVNARIATDFFNSISSINDFSEDKAINIINLLGDGSVGEEFTQCFIMFIHNKLDAIPSPGYLLNESDEDVVINKLKSLIGPVGKESYRSNIASVIVTRIINCVNNMIEEGSFKKNKKAYVSRVEKIIVSNLVSKDLSYHLVKSLSKNSEFQSLFTNPIIVSQVLS